MNTPEPKKPEVNLFVLCIILLVTAACQIWQGITWPFRAAKRWFTRWLIG